MNLHVHHLKKRSQLGPDTADNLITLCASCHSREHNMTKEPSKTNPEPGKPSPKKIVIALLPRWNKPVGAE
jgi:5-methylcytosine-specific restriction endonuclease McrA